MSAFLKQQIAGRCILILGLGLEGQSTYHAIRKAFPHMRLAVADRDEKLMKSIHFLSKDPHLDILLGKAYLDELSKYDLIIKSPGIPLKELPLIVSKTRITSQTELFVAEYRDQIIGITGTKGKSTTTELTAHLLRQFTQDVVVVGNIGTPAFDFIDQIGEKTHIVFEMSSHQLEQIKVSPKVAILLNLFQEHLDHYPSYSAYQESKLNISRYQEPGDYTIYCKDNPLLAAYFSKPLFKGKLLPISLAEEAHEGAFQKAQHIYVMIDGMLSRLVSLKAKKLLKGEHNVYNMMAALLAAKLHGLPDQLARDGISTFHPLEHRIEYVGNHHNIDFYNDSIATIPEATLAAIKSLENIDTLILGGFDRGIDYSILAEELPKTQIRNLIFMGEAGRRMRSLSEPGLNRNQHCFDAMSMDEVVALAFSVTEAGKICLLSPAAASYDWFKDFRDRGNSFKNLVRSAKNQH